MRCILDNLPSDTIAGFQSGATIAGLLPTILALIAASPLELVQLAFLSPHRALATACFGIGLPAGLFRQLRATAGTNLTDLKPNAPRTREWSFRLPPMRAATKRQKWEAASLTLFVDAMVCGLTALAVWFNYRVSSRAMITWRCEYGWLIFMWPFACIVWLLLSLSILWAMSESISVELHAFEKVKRLSVGQLMMLPYRSSSRVTQLYLDADAIESPSGGFDTNFAIQTESVLPIASTGTTNKKSCIATAKDRRIIPNQSNIVLEITMPREHGARSWRWYEAIIETLAVGVYLYATFVLTSTQFLSGNTSLTYVTIMALCSSIVRILESIFWSPRS